MNISPSDGAPSQAPLSDAGLRRLMHQAAQEAPVNAVFVHGVMTRLPKRRLRWPLTLERIAYAAGAAATVASLPWLADVSTYDNIEAFDPQIMALAAPMVAALMLTAIGINAVMSGLYRRKGIARRQ